MSKRTDNHFGDDFDVGTPATLYPLKMGGSQEAPEGLLSWIVGLAQTHCLGPRILIKHLMSEDARYREVWSGVAFFERDCGTVNGLGTYARMMSDVLGDAGAHDVSRMTLLALSHLFPRNGEGLLARQPRWCPACLCDQVRAGQRIHYPLFWSLEYYRTCHIHLTQMQECCPACSARQPHLPNYPSLSNCGVCGEPLLAALPEEAEGKEVPATGYEQWSADALVDLIRRQRCLESEGSLATFRENIEAVVDRFSSGNRKRLCEQVGLQDYALNGWVNKGDRPSLAVLLRLCYGVGILPASMFLPDAVETSQRNCPATASASERENRPLLGYKQRERIERQLDSILNDPSDFRCLAAVAQQMGLTHHALKYWFARQSRDIVRKNRACTARKMQARFREEHDYLRTVMQDMRAEGVEPTRRKVDAELAKISIALCRRDLFSSYQTLRQLL